MNFKIILVVISVFVVSLFTPSCTYNEIIVVEEPGIGTQQGLYPDQVWECWMFDPATFSANVSNVARQTGWTVTRSTPVDGRVWDWSNPACNCSITLNNSGNIVQITSTVNGQNLGGGFVEFQY